MHIILRVLFFMGSSFIIILQWFYIADWAGNKDDQTSATTFILYSGKNLILCASINKEQSHSSIEIEYHVVAFTTIELNRVQSLLHDLLAILPSPLILKCDNIEATYVCANLVFHSHIKLVVID